MAPKTLKNNDRLKCRALNRRPRNAARFGQAARPLALAALAFPLHRSRGTGVRLLPIDAPIAQFVERNRLTGNSAAHIGARTDNAEIAVMKFDFRFPGVGGTPLEFVHGESSQFGALCHDQRVRGTPSSITGAFTGWTKNDLSGKGAASLARMALCAQRGGRECSLRQSSRLSRLDLKTQDSTCKFSFATTMSIRR
jgi:hypothetical protein